MDTSRDLFDGFDAALAPFAAPPARRARARRPRLFCGARRCFWAAVRLGCYLQ